MSTINIQVSSTPLNNPHRQKNTDERLKEKNARVKKKLKKKIEKKKQKKINEFIFLSVHPAVDSHLCDVRDNGSPCDGRNVLDAFILRMTFLCSVGAVSSRRIFGVWRLSVTVLSLLTVYKAHNNDALSNANVPNRHTNGRTIKMIFPTSLSLLHQIIKIN